MSSNLGVDGDIEDTNGVFAARGFSYPVWGNTLKRILSSDAGLEQVVVGTPSWNNLAGVLTRDVPEGAVVTAGLYPVHEPPSAYGVFGVTGDAAKLLADARILKTNTGGAGWNPCLGIPEAGKPSVTACQRGLRKLGHAQHYLPLYGAAFAVQDLSSHFKEVGTIYSEVKLPPWSETVIDPWVTTVEDHDRHVNYVLPLGVSERLSALRDAAEEEGNVWAAETERQFLAFMMRHGASKPSIGVADNGDIKALWSDDGRQVLIRFTGGDYIGAVLIGKASDGALRHEALRATPGAVDLLIETLDLGALLNL